MTISAKPFVVLNFDIFVRVGELSTFGRENALNCFSFPGHEGGLSIHCSFQELLQIRILVNNRILNLKVFVANTVFYVVTVAQIKFKEKEIFKTV